MKEDRHSYVCSYCGCPAAYDGRLGDPPYLVCGHNFTGDWDRNTYVPGLGTPVPKDQFDVNNRVDALAAEIESLKHAIRNIRRD